MVMVAKADLASGAVAGDAAMIHAGLKAFAKIADLWGLKNAAAAELLDVEPRTWTRMKNGSWSGRLTQDQTLRLSTIIGLYKGLHLYFSDALADRWVGLVNSGPPFMGQAPLDYCRAGGLPALLATRSYVDALRGGL
ncbi:MAG: antitoxin Xre-like helix-turn-helix domain-containing protein [Pseudomonadota bacterium]